MAKKTPTKVKQAGEKRPAKPAGFNAVSALLIVLILIIAGVGGYYIFSFGAPSNETPGNPIPPEIAKKGEDIYNRLCVGCHGKNGVGEDPSDMYRLDAQGKVIAPPLDSSAHAWHHTDEALSDTILNGSPQNPRMRAWKDTITEEDARTLVAYIKSLWGPQQLKCQGPAHMQPECQAISNAP